MTEQPWTVPDYAIKLVVDGIQSHAEDDMNEDGLIAEDWHENAVDLATWIARTIQVNPQAMLDLVAKTYPDIPLAKVLAG